MSEQPLVDIEVQMFGVQGVMTAVGQLAQETVKDMDDVDKAVERLMQSQEQQLNSLLAQVQTEGTEVWQKRRDEIKATQDELEKLRQSQQKVTEETAAYGGTVQSILGATGSRFSALARQIPGATLMQGGLLALFLYGYAETGRLDAEANTLTQILEASSTRAVGNIRPVIEVFNDLENRSMATRAQLEGITAAFAQMGVPFEVLTGDINDVSKNIVMASASFDAFLERGSGTTAKDFLTLMSRYNISGEELIMTYGKIARSARESQMGTERFMTAIFDASRVLKTYGVDINQLTGLFANLNQTMTEMGVPKEARLAGLGGIAQGLANIPQQWRAMIGMDIMRNTPGQQGSITPMGGIMAFETGGMEGQTNMLVQSLTSLQGILREQTAGRGEQEQRELLYTLLRGMNFSPEAAAILRDLFMNNTDFQVMAQTPGRIDNLKDAMQSEAQKRSDWEQASKAIMGAMQQLAMGIFEVLTTTLSVIVGGVTYLIGWAEGLEGGKEMRAETVKVLGDTINTYKESFGRFTESFSLMGEAGKTLTGGLGVASRYADIYENQEMRRTGERAIIAGGPLERMAYLRSMGSLSATPDFGLGEMGEGAGGFFGVYGGYKPRGTLEGGLGEGSIDRGAMRRMGQRVRGEDVEIQGALETTGDRVAIVFNMEDFIAAWKYNPEGSEGVV